MHGVELVSVLVLPVIEIAQRNHTEDGERREPTDRHPAASRRGNAEPENREAGDAPRNHAKLRDLLGLDGLHPDVVIERVDALEIVLAGAGHVSGVDVHPEPFRVLRRQQPDSPNRRHQRDEHQRGCEQDEESRELRHVQLYLALWSIWACAFLLTFAMSFTPDPGGETRM